MKGIDCPYSKLFVRGRILSLFGILVLVAFCFATSFSVRDDHHFGDKTTSRYSQNSLFSELDENRDGKIELEEMREVPFFRLFSFFTFFLFTPFRFLPFV